MHPQLRVPAALVGASLAGMLVATQSRVNGGLSQELGGGFVASFVSFGSGLVLVTIAMLFSRRALRGFGKLRNELSAGRFPVWGLYGGAAGAVFVLSQSFVAPAIGVALFTVGVVAGQVLGGLVLDKVGAGPGGKVNPSVTRLIGTVLVIVAVAVSVAGSLFDGVLEGSAWLVIVPLIAGFGVAWQSAVNGLLRSAMESVLSATVVSFVVGTAILAVLAAVSVAVDGWPTQWPTDPILYLGGLLGAIFIPVLAMLVRVAGVLLLGMANVAGQLIASVLLEYGAPLAGGVSTGMLIGMMIGLAAVAIGAIPTRPRGEAPQAPPRS